MGLIPNDDTFITNIDNRELVKTKLACLILNKKNYGAMRIESTAYAADGSVLNSCFALHTERKDLLADFWNLYDNGEEK